MRAVSSKLTEAKNGTAGLSESLHKAAFSESWLAFEKKLFTLLEKPTSSKTAYIIAIFFVICILLSTLTFAISTLEEYEDNVGLAICEILFNVVFTAEFFLRLISKLSCLNELISDPMAWIDLLAILPFYVELLSHTNDLEALRVARVFRIIKMSRYYYGSQILAKAMEMSVSALLVTMFFFLLMVILFGTCIYYTEAGEEPDSDGSFESIPAGIWYMMLMSTAGVGDAQPTTMLGRLVMVAAIISGIFFIAMPLAVIGNNFTTVWDEKERTLLFIALRTHVEDLGLEAEDVVGIFKNMDEDRSGTISYKEFKNALERLNIDFPKGCLKEVFVSFDEEGDGEVPWRELCLAFFPNMDDLREENEQEMERLAAERENGGEFENGEVKGNDDDFQQVQNSLFETSSPNSPNAKPDMLDFCDVKKNANKKGGKMTSGDTAQLLEQIQRNLTAQIDMTTRVEARVQKLERKMEKVTSNYKQQTKDISQSMQQLLAANGVMFQQLEGIQAKEHAVGNPPPGPHPRGEVSVYDQGCGFNFP